MRRVILLLVATSAFGSGAVRAAPADRVVTPPGGESCSGCHGRGSGLPDLAGRRPDHIEAAMAGFRDGTRPATIMNRIAKGLTPDETRAIAAWLATQDAGR